MNVKTKKLLQKDKSCEYRVEISDGKNQTIFKNDGSDKLNYEDFTEGMIECGSSFWKSHIGNDETLYIIRHWGQTTREEQTELMREFINKCLSVKIRFADGGDTLEYEE